jgi:hypothetical protein
MVLTFLISFRRSVVFEVSATDRGGALDPSLPSPSFSKSFASWRRIMVIGSQIQKHRAGNIQTYGKHLSLSSNFIGFGSRNLEDQSRETLMVVAYPVDWRGPSSQTDHGLLGG